MRIFPRSPDRAATPRVSPTSSAASDNPFLRARAEFEHVFTNLARARRNWQLVAFAALALLALRIVQDGYMTLTAHVVPYVVEVDKFGRAQAFGPAEPLKATDRRVLIAQLALFIRNIRTVLPDATAQADMMSSAYAYVAPSAANTLNAYFAQPQNDPRLVGQRVTRRVEVTTVLQVPGTQTWKMQWTEIETAPHSGDPPRESAWEAYLAVTMIPPKTTETLQLNPLGVYVTAINWTRIGADSTLANMAASLPKPRDTASTPMLPPPSPPAPSRGHP